MRALAEARDDLASLWRRLSGVTDKLPARWRAHRKAELVSDERNG